MNSLMNYNRLLVFQHKAWAEAFTGIEVKNSYTVANEQGDPIYKALEEGGSFFTRMFLRSTRPFTINIYDMQDKLVLKLKRTFKWIFHHLDVLTPEGALIGSVDWRFKFVVKRYTVSDASGNELFELKSPLTKPWTLMIISPNYGEQGMIQKKWSGLGKELFTKADNFMLELPANWEKEKRALLLGAVFLIDFVHFEKKN